MSVNIINNYNLNASIFLDSRKSIESLSALRDVSSAGDILYPHGFEVFCIEEGTYYINVSPNNEIPEWEQRITINDEETSFTTTYSSKKISELLKDSAGINDNIISPTATFSSQKIMELIGNGGGGGIVGGTNPGANINDEEPSAITTYSSQKIESVFSELRQESVRIDDELLDMDNRVDYLEGEMWKIYGFDGSYDSLTNKPTLLEDNRKYLLITNDEPLIINKSDITDSTDTVSISNLTGVYGNLVANDDGTFTYTLSKFLNDIEEFEFTVGDSTQKVAIVPYKEMLYDDNFIGITYGGLSTWEIIEDEKCYKGSVHYTEGVKGSPGSIVMRDIKGTGYELLVTTNKQATNSTVKIYDSNSVAIKAYAIDMTTEETYYMTPCFSVTDCKYDLHRIVVSVGAVTYSDGTVENAKIYFDGFRVYNPLGEVTNQSVLNLYNNYENTHEINRVLYTDRTNVKFDPTLPYHPATKEYVDSCVNEALDMPHCTLNPPLNKEANRYYIFVDELEANNTYYLSKDFPNTGVAWMAVKNDDGSIVTIVDSANDIKFARCYNSTLICRLKSTTFINIFYCDALFGGYDIMLIKSNGVWTYTYKPHILSAYNDIEFTPTKDYAPATKKYVDDMVASVGNEGSGLPLLSSICMKNEDGSLVLTSGVRPMDFELIPKDETVVYLDDITNTSVQNNAYLGLYKDGELTNVTLRLSSVFPIVSIGYRTNTQQLVFGNTFNTILCDLTDGTRTTQNSYSLSAKANSSDILTKTNTTEYTPSANYHPATKKYVDDAIIQSVVGGDVDLSGYTTKEYVDEINFDSKLTHYNYYKDSIFNTSKTIHLLDTQDVESGATYFTNIDGIISLYYNFEVDVSSVIGTYGYKLEMEMRNGNENILERKLYNIANTSGANQLASYMTTNLFPNTTGSFVVRLTANSIYDESGNIIDSPGKSCIMLVVGKNVTAEDYEKIKQFKISFAILKQNFLQLDNINEYTPTKDYHPATKKYVDDMIAQNSGGGSTQGVTQEDILQLFVELDVVQPLVDENGYSYTDSDGKIFIL